MRAHGARHIGEDEGELIGGGGKVVEVVEGDVTP